MNQNHADLCPSTEGDATSLPSTDLHDFHIGDVYNPVDPATLITRLQTVGFGAITVSVDYGFTFRARKPDPARDGIWEHSS